MPNATVLTIAYSTMAARAHNISLAGIAPDNEVLVCVQGGPLPCDGELARARVIPVPGTGVAKSRNASIECARGRYLLFGDDDVTVNLAGVGEGIRHLQRTGHALALGQGTDPSGSMRKRYPRHVTPLTPFNSAKAATYEMLIDLSQVRAKGVRFDVRFGAGTDLHLGDEYIFIMDLLRAGLSGDAVPVIFGTHPRVSSGTQWGSPEDSHARAVALNRVFGRWAPFARMAFGLKNATKFGSWRALETFLTNSELPPADAHTRWATMSPGSTSER
ncbi:glycosyltransferase [Actinopolymorpha sp. B17G11]|uniref:glycosyltransferase n=1 Tax=unclassified Actinopolymorpha TaxID=2627063 RepID=UPI0032D8FB35